MRSLAVVLSRKKAVVEGILQLARQNKPDGSVFVNCAWPAHFARTYVCLDDADPLSFRLDNALRFLGIILFQRIDDWHIGLLSRMERRNRAPDPAICASDDRHLSCQPLRTSVTGLPLGLGSQSAFAAGQRVLVEHLLRVVISLLLVSGSTRDRSACNPPRADGVQLLCPL